MMGRKIRRSANSAAHRRKSAKCAKHAQRRQIGENCRREPASQDDGCKDQSGTNKNRGPLDPNGRAGIRPVL